jgi:hypothetical protein
MKFIVVLLSCFISVTAIDAQRIRVNGEVTTRTELPIEGVMVMAFDNGTLLKSYVTDAKGQYSFNVDKMVFDVLFYKPGFYSHSYRLDNRLDKETQGINIDIHLDDSVAETAVNLAFWLKQHILTQAEMDTIYADEINKIPPPSAKHKSKKEILKDALAEQKRFSNYKETKTSSSVDDQEKDVTTVIIGPDTYELITSDKEGKRYYKNNKPITQVTYKFETTRRYEGVLKSSKHVKKIDRYRPLQHVKG